VDATPIAKDPQIDARQQAVGARRQVPFDGTQLVAGANDPVFASRKGGALAERTVNRRNSIPWLAAALLVALLRPGE
jgi:hypothetical protein